MKQTTVLVVGAGPVGLLIALALGRANIPTILLEKHSGALPNTVRATAYQPVVLSCLQGLGILEKVKDISYLNKDGIVWRDRHGNSLARLPVDESEPILLLGQARLAQLVLRELRENCPSVEVLYGLHVVGLTQTQEKVTALLRETQPSHDNDVSIDAHFVMGTDGANSSVRHALAIPYDGYSFLDFKLIGCDILYDFSKHNKWGTPMQFLVDPTDWAVILYVGQDEHGNPYGDGTPLWRVAYSESSHLDQDHKAVVERANERIKGYAQGSTNFELKRAEPYRIQQRCARQAYRGNVFLAGDALHANNPVGGLGLTTGILDAYCYGNALVRVIKDGEPSELLAACADSRRKAFLDTTNEMSTRNLKHLMSLEPEDIKAREQFFAKLNNEPSSFPQQVRAQMGMMIPETFAKV